ncbi:hypothetical protein RND81_04G074100 [Saponaria officinalis]|uniref:Uncharacterized protein n=1 Tax=Saponaria officinalis TaxID=3572 RepID=A0AAW1LJP7_SAPOF
MDVKARKIRMLILDDSWWEKVEYFLEFMKTIYQMIKFGDRDAPVLHLIYDMWDCMIEDIKVVIFKREGKYINHVLELRWNKSNTPLHCLAHSLVPKYYSINWLNDGRTIFQRVLPHQDLEVSTQRNLCFQRLFPDPIELRNVLKEYGSFSSGLDYFSQAHVIASRDEEEPISCVYENIKTVKRNRLTSTPAKDLVKVHNNLRLLDRQEDSYKTSPYKYWDIGGDKFDVDADISELADLTMDDPKLERVVYSLGYEADIEDLDTSI